MNKYLSNTLNVFGNTLFLIVALFAGSAVHASSTKCVEGVVKTIAVGYGAIDSGNGIRVEFEEISYEYHSNGYDNDGYYYLDESRNLNDSVGSALLSLLLYSKSTGYKVSLYDHHGTSCDDFQEVYLLD